MHRQYVRNQSASVRRFGMNCTTFGACGSIAILGFCELVPLLPNVAPDAIAKTQLARPLGLWALVPMTLIGLALWVCGWWMRSNSVVALRASIAVLLSACPLAAIVLWVQIRIMLAHPDLLPPWANARRLAWGAGLAWMIWTAPPIGQLILMYLGRHGTHADGTVRSAVERYSAND